MARNDFQQQLADLEEDVLYMSELVLERLRKGLDALEQKDRETAREVIEGDHEINQLYLELEQDCIDLLALQQPVASDLRFIASSFKIITDLERVGDLATNLAEYSLNAYEDVFPEVDVQAIGALTHDMIEDAMAAYAERDTDACRAIAAGDDELDELCEQASQTVVRDLIERELDAPEDEEIEELLNDVSRLLLTIRDLERVGDHAVNISARTLYMVESDDELIY
ncbi:phosphate signaling complex protein PhoU [Natronoarchaeum rubrum]|uniref:phosphate signaling complex protein PhoU n=1 Tax=Natronoarchaeum rubrum TaxID=755311 RepID=UPI0021131524|nr:phosphate signaling complex protein PhoU [Natronoarchaeum rubrum]HMB49169.1 phosphate signaling complex protein PhoU [Natronoarchaeum rubrum]